MFTTVYFDLKKQKEKKPRTINQKNIILLNKNINNNKDLHSSYSKLFTILYNNSKKKRIFYKLSSTILI